jgi:hypothetical protein
MHNGTVKGIGLYEDAHTGKYCGPFNKGMLNGPDCKVERKSIYGDFIQEGYFYNDKMHRSCRMTHPKKHLPLKASNTIGKRDDIDQTLMKLNKDKAITEYNGQFTDGVRHGLFRAKGGSESQSNRWIFEGMYRDGHREGVGEELYESIQSMELLGFLRGKDGKKVEEKEQKKQSKSYKYDDDEENEKKVKDDDGSSTHRRLPLRYAGRWEKTFILSRGIHSQKLGPGRFSGQYTMAKHPGEEPIIYNIINDRYIRELNLLRDIHRNDVRHWRDHRRVMIKMGRKNQHYYRRALQERRMSIFDEDLWEFLTPEEQAFERAQQNMKKGQNLQSDLRVAMRKK